MTVYQRAGDGRGLGGRFLETQGKRKSVVRCQTLVVQTKPWGPYSLAFLRLAKTCFSVAIRSLHRLACVGVARAARFLTKHPAPALPRCHHAVNHFKHGRVGDDSFFTIDRIGDSVCCPGSSGRLPSSQGSLGDFVTGLLPGFDARFGSCSHIKAVEPTIGDVFWLRSAVRICQLGLP
jgi:hypothetical protein